MKKKPRIQDRIIIHQLIKVLQDQQDAIDFEVEILKKINAKDDWTDGNWELIRHYVDKYAHLKEIA